MLRDKTKERILKMLKSMPFEEARTRILHGNLGFDEGSLSQKFCLSWLADKEAQLRDAREDSTLSIAKSAKKLTKRQLRYAIYATIIALIATAITAKGWILDSIKIIKDFIK